MRTMRTMRQRLAAIAYDSAGESDPERRIPADALEPARDHLESLREPVVRAARRREEAER